MTALPALCASRRRLGSSAACPAARPGDRARAAMRRYYEFHGRRPPADLGAEHVTAFLSDLATRGQVAASTQNQALAALLFLYREVLGRDLPWLDNLVRARRPARLPVVLTQAEMRAVLSQLDGAPRLMATLLYGSGLRLLECCRLRVKDVDFGRSQILARSGKGDKDRATLLPATIRDGLAAHLERVQGEHRLDLVQDAGWVELPGALGRKLPAAGREWSWQWVFPATRLCLHPETGQRRAADRPSVARKPDGAAQQGIQAVTGRAQRIDGGGGSAAPRPAL